MSNVNLLNPDLPYSEEAEIALLGAVMLRPMMLNKIIGSVVPGDFYIGANQSIYRVILDLFSQKNAIDVVTISNELEYRDQLERIGGIEYLSDLSEAVPTSQNIESYAKIVKNNSLRRQIVMASQVAIQDAIQPNSDIETVLIDHQSRILQLENGIANDNGGLIGYDRVINDAVKRILNIQSGKVDLGPKTGFKELDYLTNGMTPGELIILAARPAMGKSALALNIAENVASRGLPVAFFTLEMSTENFGIRSIQGQTALDMAELQRGILDQEALLKAAQRLSGLPVFIDDHAAATVDYVRRQSQKLKLDKKGPGLIVVDYLQLIDAGQGQNREQQIAGISRGLKRVAMELHVPLIALSQLNRKIEDRPIEQRIPRMSDIRESGAIEQDADKILALSRLEEYYKTNIQDMPEEYGGVANVTVIKNRSGSTGNARMKFDAPRVRFFDPEELMREQYFERGTL